VPITDFSTGFSWIFGFYSRTSTIPKSADQPLPCHVTFRDNLIASKSALALHTDARAKREFSLLDAERAKRVYMLRTGCSCTYVANQDDDTSINHLRQRPGVQHCSDKIYAARCDDTVSRNTVLGQYQVDTSIESLAEMFVNNRIIRMECFAREAHIQDTGHQREINLSLIRPM